MAKERSGGFGSQKGGPGSRENWAPHETRQPAEVPLPGDDGKKEGILGGEKPISKPLQQSGPQQDPEVSDGAEQEASPPESTKEKEVPPETGSK